MFRFGFKSGVPRNVRSTSYLGFKEVKFVTSIDEVVHKAFIHSINLKKAGFGQPKYCNNAYAHVVLTNLYSIFSICII